MGKRMAVAAVMLVALVAACGRRDSSGATGGPASTVAESGTAHPTAGVRTNVVVPPGGLTIRTTDGSIKLALVRDTIYMGLSDSTLAATRAELATKSGDSAGLGGSIEKMVKKTVRIALMTNVVYPLTDIQSARYEDGEIRFTYRDKHALSFESVSTNNKKALASFSPEDARRFVAAVNAEMHARRRQ